MDNTFDGIRDSVDGNAQGGVLTLDDLDAMIDTLRAQANESWLLPVDMALRLEEAHKSESCPHEDQSEHKFIITLQYRNKRYSYWDKFKAWDEGRSAPHVAEYMYDEGNYGCDCNRSSFIGNYCDTRFPEMRCGNKIKLISIREIGVRRPRVVRRRQMIIAQRRNGIA